ncbi:DUF1127 domain-containing protein [Microvirga flavescens]|uniref:DUF1127 domain-containing protein n=1 Tax=Microvirga flavescens TaxID=2249811 RepID=UPI00130066BC|nr:DUF1127 domain-containing protein [Microvirga flavescens]
MTHSSTSLVSPVGSTLVGRVIRVSLAQAAVFLRALKHRREVRALAEFDERMLKDIGLTRSDVDSALDESVFNNPSVLLVRSVERRARVQRSPVAKKTERPVVSLVKTAG